MARRLPVGAEVIEGGAHFRVWAPDRSSVEVVIEADEDRSAPARSIALEPERREPGWWSTIVRDAGHGTRYRYRLDGRSDHLCPDPASRYQPEGPDGPSEIVDPRRFAWSDAAWRGRTLRDAVLYELHVGTFTKEGTWRAAADRLLHLARTGITVIEVMPVAEFAGRFGWGYDGVSLFAPHHAYGAPDDLRAFVDRAHSLGIAVILDVVYNHLGPEGSHLACFARAYTTERYRTDWGDSIDFDGERSGPVRAFFVANARYWIEEHHLDGLRLDATQNVYDFGDGEHVLAEITKAVRDAAGARSTLVIGENEPQEARLVRPRERGGYGMDAIWNDDLHHAAVVALTGRNEAYYGDYAGTARELLAAAKHGFLFQGQRYAWQGKRRGTSALDLPARALVGFLENHDQVANSEAGRRLHDLADPALHRAMSALLLLGPWTPMLFQGAEMLSRAPFLYFADHHGELGGAVRRGRAEFLSQFPSIASTDLRARLHDPADPEAFERCKLDPRDLERREGAAFHAMVRALLAIRQGDPAIRDAIGGRGVEDARLDGATLAEDVLLLRWIASADPAQDRALIVTLGPSRTLRSVSEPLFAPPDGMRWRAIFSSEDPDWNGRGAVPIEQADGVHLTARSAVLLAPEVDPDPRPLPPGVTPESMPPRGVHDGTDRRKVER